MIDAWLSLHPEARWAAVGWAACEIYGMLRRWRERRRERAAFLKLLANAPRTVARRTETSS